MILEKCVTKDIHGKEVVTEIKTTVGTGKLVMDKPFVIILQDEEENETMLITSPVRNIKKTSKGMVISTLNTSYHLQD